MAKQNPVVTVKQGQLRGVHEKTVYGDPFLAFRGIPFAKPPTGSLRFKDPQPPEPWTGIREAKNFGGSCMQFNIFTRNTEGSDDCLYLNVYTPTIEETTKRAVMVWIHGGAFVLGSGDDMFYGPDYLIRKDIVLVTINYRFGILGFCNVNHEVAAGNQGLKDQVMALKWVKENISNFSGDPENVTIFGESAGSASVHFLAISPLVEGLFHKAICQSGVAVNPWTMQSDEPQQYVFELAASLGKETKDPEEVIKFLQTVDAKQLITASREIVPKEQNHIIYGRFFPTVDDKSPNPFMPKHPTILMKSGVKVPLLLGFNSAEGAVFTSPLFIPSFRGKESMEATFKKFNSNFEVLIHPELRKGLKKEGITPQDVKRIYFGDRPIGKDVLNQYVKLMGDMMFLRGIFEVVKVQMETDTPVTYFYKFTYEDDSSFLKAGFDMNVGGAAHADDLMYLFYPAMMKQMGLENIKPGSTKERVSQYFTQMWTDFAKTGNPTPKTTDLIKTIWEPVEKGEGYNYLNIGATLKMETTKVEEHTFNWKRMKNKL